MSEPPVDPPAAIDPDDEWVDEGAEEPWTEDQPADGAEDEPVEVEAAVEEVFDDEPVEVEPAAEEPAEQSDVGEPAQDEPAPLAGEAEHPADAEAPEDEPVDYPAEEPAPFEPTGHDDVDAVLAGLVALDERSVHEHVEVFEEAHTALRGVLDRSEPE